jgi:hypothetical protein
MARGIDRDLTSVFINCPFTADFRPLHEAMIFTVLACYFRPRSALEANHSGDASGQVRGCTRAVLRYGWLTLLPAFRVPPPEGRHEAGDDERRDSTEHSLILCADPRSAIAAI